MSLVTLQNLAFVTPDGETVFSDLNLSFGRERVGLIGRNGAGKSTLLKIVHGDLAPSRGSVSITAPARMLRQDLGAAPAETVADAFGVRAYLERLDKATRGLASATDLEDLDWTLEARLETALAEINLSDITPDRHLCTLSGGQRTRIALAALVFHEPDLILLDEPTNNLDTDGRAIVVDLLDRFPNGAIVASHDRTLLRRMDRIIELSSLGAKSYGGNWDFYAEQKTRERAAAEHRLTAAERELETINRKIQTASERKARKDSAGRKERRKGSDPKMVLDAKARQAQSTAGKMAHLAERQRTDAEKNLKDAQSEVERVRTATVALSSSALPSGRTVLHFDSVTAGYVPDKPVLQNLSFSVTGAERVAVVGPNGSGKSTLLKLATGALEPQTGTMHRPVPAALLDQDMSILDRRATILENFQRLNPQANHNTCRAALARMLFRGDTALRPVSTLSGGETLRVGLACAVGGTSVPQLLILDEPTNHLDLASIEAVEAGLNGYDGALLVVSHDEEFLRQIGIERRFTFHLPTGQSEHSSD